MEGATYDSDSHIGCSTGNHVRSIGSSVRSSTTLCCLNCCCCCFGVSRGFLKCLPNPRSAIRPALHKNCATASPAASLLASSDRDMKAFSPSGLIIWPVPDTAGAAGADPAGVTGADCEAWAAANSRPVKAAAAGAPSTTRIAPGSTAALCAVLAHATSCKSTPGACAPAAALAASPATGGAVSAGDCSSS